MAVAVVAPTDCRSLDCCIRGGAAASANAQMTSHLVFIALNLVVAACWCAWEWQLGSCQRCCSLRLQTHHVCMHACVRNC